MDLISTNKTNKLPCFIDRSFQIVSLLLLDLPLPYLDLHFCVYSSLNQILQFLCSEHPETPIKIDTTRFLPPSDYTIIGDWNKVWRVKIQPQAETLQISSIPDFWNEAIEQQFYSNLCLMFEQRLQVCTTQELRILLKKPFKTCLHLSMLISLNSHIFSNQMPTVEESI